MMQDKQLNVWIDSNLKDELVERAKREKMSVTGLIESILWQDRARQHGEVVEEPAVPMLREIIIAEVHQAVTQLISTLHNEMHPDLMEKIKTVISQRDDRLAKLIVQAVREAGMGRRLITAHLSKSYGPPFARSAYESAKADVGNELAGRAGTKPSQ